MSITYPFSESPALGKTMVVAPGVLWIQMPLPISLKHINLWLLADGDGWVIVDCGLHLEELKEAWRVLLAELPGKVKSLIVTHFHPDHIGLSAWLLAQLDVPLYMSLAEFETAQLVWHQLDHLNHSAMVDHFVRHGLPADLEQGMRAHAAGYRTGAPDLPHTLHRLNHGMVLTINQQQWQVIIGHGHSPEHVSLYCPQLKVLISGDMLLPKISTNVSVFALMPDENPLADFLHSITYYVEHLPDDTLVLPSHGAPFYGIQARVKALHRHHRKHLNDIVHFCDHWCSAYELIPILFTRALDRYQTMFAMGESIAHLNYLYHDQQLLRRTEDGKISFKTNNEQ